MLLNAFDCAVSPLMAVFIAPNNDMGIAPLLRSGRTEAGNVPCGRTRIRVVSWFAGQKPPGILCRHCHCEEQSDEASPMRLRTITGITSPSPPNMSGTQLAVIERRGAIAMQPALPVALPPPATASPVIGKLQLGPADFGGALAKLLAAVVPTVTATVPAQSQVPAPNPAPVTATAPTATPP